MRKLGIDAAIQSLIEQFAEELTELVARAALRAVERALDPAAARPQPEVKVKRPARYELIPAPRRAPPKPASTREPLSLDHYERLALLRALAECGGDAMAAARLLRIGKSTMYRKMHAFGIPVARQGQQPMTAVKVDAATKGPVSLKAYERLALERALRETGGHMLDAAKLLRVGKSTMYRKVTEHALK